MNIEMIKIARQFAMINWQLLKIATKISMVILKGTYTVTKVVLKIYLFCLLLIICDLSAGF